MIGKEDMDIPFKENLKSCMFSQNKKLVDVDVDVSATDTLRLYFFVKEGNSYENN